MKKKLVIGLLVVLALLGISVVKSCSRKRAVPHHQDQSEMTKAISQSSSSKEQEISKAQTEAKNTLEQPERLLGDIETNQVKDSLQIAFDYLQTVTDESAVTISYQNHLSITNVAMAQTVVRMLSTAHYTVDLSTLQVYGSDSDNVYQFTVDLTKPNTDNLSLAGNYVTGTQQLELGSLHGTPTGLQ